MSRIHEALRRASGSLISSDHEVGDTTARRAGETSIEQYPREHSQSEDRDEETVHQSEQPLLEAMPSPARGRFTAVSTRVADARLAINVGPVLLQRYRQLAATMEEARAVRGIQTIMVTSARAREGKTLTAVNLALILTQSFGRRVLLIDADVRHPSVHEHLGLKNQVGLSDALRADWRELPLVEVSPQLAVLVAGPPEQNPSSVLTSDRLRSLFTECAEQFEWVLLDAPPIGLVSDAQLLARRTQGVIFVIGAVTPFPEVGKAMAEVGRERIIGTVLNSLGERSQPPNA
jgi:capsular exopolysaccharide synthesis family protein